MHLTLFILIAVLLISVSASGYICQGNWTINPPIDPSMPYYFPGGWNEHKKPEEFNKSQTCGWIVNVPSGMYATAVFYTSASFPDTSIGGSYSNKNLFQIQNDDTAPYVFTESNSELWLQSQHLAGKFSFKIIWSYYPSNVCQNFINLDETQLIPSFPTMCATTFTAPNQVVLVGFSEETNFEEVLRYSAVYEGDSVNGKYIGNLEYAYSNNIRSLGRNLTVYTFGTSRASNRTLFMGLDKKAAGNVEYFQGLHCSSDVNTFCGLSSSKMNAVTAVVTSSKFTDYLKYPKSMNDFVEIYEGQINNDHLLARLNPSNYKNQFPLAVKRFLKIYKFSGIGSEIEVTRDQYAATYNFDRYVNIHSFDYRQQSYNQDTTEEFTVRYDIDSVDFYFIVNHFDVNGPTTLQIQVFQNDKVAWNLNFDGSNMPPNNTFIVTGDSAIVRYSTYGCSTKGFQVDLRTRKTVIVPYISSLPLSTTSKYETTTKLSIQRFSPFIFIGTYFASFLLL